MRPLCFLSLAACVLLAGCSSTTARPSKVYGAGEKALVDHLTYSVVDTEIHTRLGEDASPRLPQTRFTILQIAVSNSSNSDISIPGLTLVDDSGKAYPELADGAGVQHWLGIIRKVGPGQTERGGVLFDAPAGHYKLKLTDETSNGDVFIDIPLSFVHELELTHDVNAPTDAPAAENATITPKKK